MTPNELLVEDRGPVRILTMNRPDKRNALNYSLTEALLVAVRAANTDDAIGAIVLTGAGQGFCAGADLNEFKDLDPATNREFVEKRAEVSTHLHNAFREISKPVVTAINGAAMGGGSGLALAGDLAIIGRSAKIGYPEIKHGIVAAIVMPNLVRHVGRKAAFEILSLGLSVTPERALELGMVNRVVADDRVLDEAVALATQLASMSRPAMALTKQLFHEVNEIPFAEALDAGRRGNARMRAFRKAGEAGRASDAKK